MFKLKGQKEEMEEQIEVLKREKKSLDGAFPFSVLGTLL